MKKFINYIHLVLYVTIYSGMSRISRSRPWVKKLINLDVMKQYRTMPIIILNNSTKYATQLICLGSALLSVNWLLISSRRIEDTVLSVLVVFFLNLAFVLVVNLALVERITGCVVFGLEILDGCHFEDWGDDLLWIVKLALLLFANG